jgi:hypothetical protein
MHVRPANFLTQELWSESNCRRAGFDGDALAVEHCD